jgi:ribosomal protein S6
MSTTKVYPKGMRIFPPRNGAPEFVIGEMVVNLKEFSEFIKSKEAQEYYSEYNGEKQLKFTLLKGDKGPYVTVNTYKPAEQTASIVHSTPVEADDDLPF